MSLAILVPLVVVGVAAIIAVIQWSGLSRPAEIGGEAAARERFTYDFPLSRIVHVDITSDRRAAFLALDDGATGLVETFGDRMVTQLLGRDTVAFAYAEGPRLIVQGTEFTWKGGAYAFADADTAKAIANRLNGLGHPVGSSDREMP